jgi:hypothetical protein
MHISMVYGSGQMSPTEEASEDDKPPWGSGEETTMQRRKAGVERRHANVTETDDSEDSDMHVSGFPVVIMVHSRGMILR